MSQEQKGVVSIWAFLKPEDPADKDMDVLKDFAGVDSYDIDSQEGAISDSEVPLVSLIEKLSYSASFVDEAMAAAKRMNIESGYGVIAQYDFAYDPSKVQKPIRRDPVFIGYFPWHD